jgi:hypothetical protein
MKVKALIEALQNMDENAEIEIALMQYNKKYPVEYLSINDTINKENPMSYQMFVTQFTENTVRIKTYLPEKTYLVKRN